MQTGKHTTKGSILALKPRTDIIISETGLLVAPQKGHMSSKHFFFIILVSDSVNWCQIWCKMGLNMMSDCDGYGVGWCIMA